MPVVRDQIAVRDTQRGTVLEVGGVVQSLVKGNDNPRTGDVWDMLALPFALVAQRVTRPEVLMLGLGLGAVPRIIRSMEGGRAARITAVECNADVVKAFELHGPRHVVDDVVVCSAGAILAGGQRRWSSAQYDLVIEDTFTTGWAKPTWACGAAEEAPTRAGGVFVQNWLPSSYNSPLATYRRSAIRRYGSAVVLSNENLANRVIVATLEGVSSVQVRRAAREAGFVELLPRLRCRKA